MRVRKALVVRPPSDGWPDELRFEPPLVGPRTLPLELIASASDVKLCSTHRVSMHDAATGADAAKAIDIHRPDAVAIAWHPASRDGAREVARVARGKAKAVVALAPARMVALAAADGPYDGALDTHNGAGLVALMNALGEGGAEERVQAALDTPSARVGTTIDRKLLDYARYQGSRGARWRPAVRAFRPVASLSGSPLSDKGRFAASEVFVDGPMDAVVADVNECALLGIPWLDLRTREGAAPSPELWEQLLPRLARLRSETPGLDPDIGGVRLRMDPAHVARIDAPTARRAGVAAVDFGLLEAADAARAIEAAGPAKRAGWVTTAELALRTADDESALRALDDAGVAVQGRVPAALPIESLEAMIRALTALRAPARERDAACRLAREIDAGADARLVRPRRPSVRAIVKRLLR